MRLTSVNATGVTTLQQVYQAPANDMIISAALIGGATSTASVDVYINNDIFIRNYPVPQKGLALAEIEGQLLNEGDTISVESDLSINLRLTLRIKEY